MKLGFGNSEHEHRPVGFSVAGVILLLMSAVMLYDLMQRQTEDAPVSSAYNYKINQSVESNLNYSKNNYFSDGPGTNTAYVAALTDTIDTTFHYNYHATEQTELTYSYEIASEVRGNYAVQAGSTTTPPSVWTKQHQLVAPKTVSNTSSDVRIDEAVSIPFAEYRSEAESFRSGLSLPLNSEVVVTFIIKISGTVGGTPFDDTRTSTITAPLDQVVYTLATEYDKTDTKQVVPQDTMKSRTMTEKYQVAAAAFLGVVGLALLIYGLRRHIFKTSYQRELDRIYRYNDGIIVKARQAADLSGKHIVPVLTFDDMINLEEELKMPIVASPMGDETTQFIIMHGDVAYVYTIGKQLLDETSIDDLAIDIDTVPITKHHKK